MKQGWRINKSSNEKQQIKAERILPIFNNTAERESEREKGRERETERQRDAGTIKDKRKQMIYRERKKEKYTSVSCVCDKMLIEFKTQQ